jgi:cytochrome c-type biogenesis protein CcmH/NrfF
MNEHSTNHRWLLLFIPVILLLLGAIVILATIAYNEHERGRENAAKVAYLENELEHHRVANVVLGEKLQEALGKRKPTP